MNDGPAGNSNLPPDLRRFNRVVGCETFDLMEATQFGAHAVLREFIQGGVQPLFRQLDSYCNQMQPELDPTPSVERVFAGFETNPQAEAMRKETLYRLQDGKPPWVAIPEAMAATIRDQIELVQLRLKDENLRAREEGEITQAVYVAKFEQSAAALRGIPVDGVQQALLDDDRTRFKPKRKTGVGEGPPL